MNLNGVTYLEALHRDTMDMWCAECEKIHKFKLIAPGRVEKPADLNSEGQK